MSSGESRRVEEALRAAAGYLPARGALVDLLLAEPGYLPEGLLAPLREALFRKEVREHLHGEAGAAAAKALGVELNFAQPLIRDPLEWRALESARRFARESIPDPRPRDPIGAPSIEEVTETPVGGDFCCMDGGNPVRKLKAGMIVTIRGRSFDRVPSRNVVRLGDQRLPVAQASDEALIVCVIPPASGGKRKDGVNWQAGKVPLSVETVAGKASAEVEIEAPHPTGKDAGEFAGFVRDSRDLLGLFAERLSVGKGYFDPIRDGEAGQAAQDVLQDANLVLGRAAKQLERVGAAVDLADKSVPDLRLGAMIGELARNARLAERLQAVKTELDDPKSALLSGSGLVDAICSFTSFMWKSVLYWLIVAVLVLLVMAVALFFGPGGGPVILILLLVLTLVLIMVVLCFVVAVVTTIVYGVVKLIDWLSGKIGEWIWG